MNVRFWSPPLLAALVAAALLALGATLVFARGGGAGGPSSAEQARRVATQFFTALNARRYDRACSLLSKDFYRLNRVARRADCVLGLTVGIGMSDIKFRITGVSAENGRATVHALANGAPGEIVLIEERGRYKVLALESA